MDPTESDEAFFFENAHDTYSQCFNRWKSVSEQFASILDSFLTESTNLDSLLKQSSAQTWQDLEKSLAYVDKVYRNLQARCLQVQKARAILGAIRNRSRSLTPFNTLPVETIQRILQFASMECIVNRKDSQSLKKCMPSPLQNILTTCKHLQNVSTGLPSLWTHIDLVLDDKLSRPYLRHAKSCLKYSAQLPLHVHVAENIDPNKKPSVEGLVKLLKPSVYQIISLDSRISISVARPLILGLYRNTPPTSCQLNELFVVDRESDSRWLSPSFYESFFGHKGWDRFSLPNLRTLGIYAPYIPLASSVYRALTVLKLAPNYTQFTPLRPTLQELSGVLAACPDLRSLSLIGCEFQNTNEKIEAVCLAKLEILDLRKTFKDDLIQLISCITTKAPELTLTVSYNPEMSEMATDKLRSFIKHANVTRLMLDATRHYGPGSLVWLLHSLPSVRELALSQYCLNSPPPGLFSGLDCIQTLHLLWCPLTPEGLGPALECSTIEVMRINDQDWYTGKLAKLVPRLKRCKYPVTTDRGVDLEWPVALPHFG